VDLARIRDPRPLAWVAADGARGKSARRGAGTGARGTRISDSGGRVAGPERLDTAELGYLGGRTLGELLDAERNATAAALAASGRMNMSITLERIDAPAIGELIMLLQIATVYAGGLYGVDPMDQPGVELGKRLTYGLMGRAGFEPPDLTPGEERWIDR